MKFRSGYRKKKCCEHSGHAKNKEIARKIVRILVQENCDIKQATYILDDCKETILYSSVGRN